MPPHSLTVVGLGPAGADLINAATRASLDSADVVIARTRRHQACDALAAGTIFCDDLYEGLKTIEQVYAAIVERVVDAATAHDKVVYAVPGSPAVAEHTVELLIADPRVCVTVLPALSFVDLTWTALGIDPFAQGVTIADAYRFDECIGARGPVLVGQVDQQWLCSEIKLAVDPWPDEPVTVLQRLGQHDQAIFEVSWSELDRIEPDHLTSLYLRSVPSRVGAAAERFEQLVTRLRQYCPWDREQTHRSLRRYAIEETYELVDALDAYDEATLQGREHLVEELGDVAFQVFFHAVIGAESGAFDLAEILDTVHDKLVYRHPHVFSGTRLSAEEMVTQWESLKVQEKNRDSIFDGIARHLPALAIAAKVAKKAAASGIDLRTDVALGDEGEPAAVWAQGIFDEVEAAGNAGIDPEMALREWCWRLIDEVTARPGSPTGDAEQS